MIQYPLGVNGVTTRVLDSGPEGGSGEDPLILVHGLGARADRFQHNVAGLAEAGRRTIALDLPGHGLAQKGPLPYSVPYYASYLQGVMDQLGIDRAGLIGTSLGGNVVARAAVEAPDRVSSLVLVGSLGLVPLGVDTRTMISHAVLNRSREAVAAKLDFVLQRRELITADLVEEEFRIANSPGTAEAAEALSDYFLHRVDEDVVGERLAELADHIPTLLVWGAADRTIPVDVGHAAQKVLSKARLVLLRGTGHAPYLERPTMFNDVVLKFLSDNLKESHVQTV